MIKHPKLFVASILLLVASCTAQQVHDSAALVQGAAVSADAVVGSTTPWGLIIGAVGSVAGVIASLTGAHAVAQAQAKGVDPHPVSNFLANHTYFYPLVSTALTALNPYVLHLSPDHLAAISGMLAVVFGTQAAGSAIVSAGSSAAPAAPAPAPAPLPTVIMPPPPAAAA